MCHNEDKIKKKDIVKLLSETMLKTTRKLQGSLNKQIENLKINFVCCSYLIMYFGKIQTKSKTDFSLAGLQFGQFMGKVSKHSLEDNRKQMEKCFMLLLLAL